MVAFPRNIGNAFSTKQREGGSGPCENRHPPEGLTNHPVSTYGLAMDIDIRSPDWTSLDDRNAVVELLDAYSRGPTGGSKPLTEFVRANLCRELAARPSVAVLLAFRDGEAAGLCIANEGFSTFACKPLLNIHDLVTAPTHRGNGVARALLAGAEKVARERGCCKLTLEVLEGNAIARDMYHKTGFVSYELDPATGRALFLEKKLA
jgi:ribosomal protein S18 acetylase RimI-like enzyme